MGFTELIYVKIIKKYKYLDVKLDVEVWNVLYI